MRTDSSGHFPPLLHCIESVGSISGQWKTRLYARSDLSAEGIFSHGCMILILYVWNKMAFDQLKFNLVLSKHTKVRYWTALSKLQRFIWARVLKPKPGNWYYPSRNVMKRTVKHVLPAKIQISLRIRAVWSESSLGAFWIAKDAKCQHVVSEDSDQTPRMRRLIWVFVGRTCHDVLFLRSGWKKLCTTYIP